MSGSRKSVAVMRSQFGDQAATLFTYVRDFGSRLIALPADPQTGGHFTVISPAHDTARFHLVYERPAMIDPLEKALRNLANRAFKGRFTLHPRAELILEREDGGNVKILAFVRAIDKSGRTGDQMAHYQLNWLRLSDERLRRNLDNRLSDWVMQAVKACPDMKLQSFQSMIRQAAQEPTGRKPGEA